MDSFTHRSFGLAAHLLGIGVVNLVGELDGCQRRLPRLARGPIPFVSSLRCRCTRVARQVLVVRVIVP